MKWIIVAIVKSPFTKLHFKTGNFSINALSESLRFEI